MLYSIETHIDFTLCMVSQDWHKNSKVHFIQNSLLFISSNDVVQKTYRPFKESIEEVSYVSQRDFALGKSEPV
jgi:hypothetical protein